MKVLKERLVINSNLAMLVEESNQQNILKDIIQPIYDSDIILADLTGLNPNVMYELALAHAFKKKTVIITQDPLSSLPFDLKSYRAKNYDVHFNKFDDLIEYLDKNMTGAIDGSILYSNPVDDFLKTSNVDASNKKELSNVIESDKLENGVLDFLEGIEKNTKALADVIVNYTQDIDQMGSEIRNNTSEMERVKSNGSDSIAVFLRKITKKIARSIDVFDRKLRGHNELISGIWDDIERDTYGLLESRLVDNSENKESLKKYLSSLKSLQISIGESNIQIDGLRKSMDNANGIERSLNQAIRLVKDDLSTYLDIAERIIGSIDLILERAKPIISEVKTSLD